MRRIILTLTALAFLTTTGCRWFVPGAIKQESSIIRVDVENCQKEVLDLQTKAENHRKLAAEAQEVGDNATAMEETKIADDLSKQASDKAVRSYRRVTPHVVNMENYMTGRDSKGNK